MMSLHINKYNNVNMIHSDNDINTSAQNINTSNKDINTYNKDTNTSNNRSNNSKISMSGSNSIIISILLKIWYLVSSIFIPIHLTNNEYQEKSEIEKTEIIEETDAEQKDLHLSIIKDTNKDNEIKDKDNKNIKDFHEGNEYNEFNDSDIQSIQSIQSINSSTATNNYNLFPSITQNNNNDITSGTATAIPCSTGLTTRLLPFKNSNGEIEWAFTDDLPANELDVFKLSNNNPNMNLNDNNNNINLNDDSSNSDNNNNNKNSINNNDELSPITSNSSNNESIISTKKKDGKFINSNETPISSTSSSSPFTPDDHKLHNHNHNHNNGSNSHYHPHESNMNTTINESNYGSPTSNEEDGKIHQCPHCEATFKIRGYLTRHLKKHAVKKAYSCPFHKFSIYIDENNITHKCHPNGGFSRRDTYKTHLKSRHFKYPKGTKTKERNLSSGNCSMCGEFFPNSEIWCEIHVEGGECKYLPVGFKGKSRIKNRLRKQMNKKLKESNHNLTNNNSNTITSTINDNGNEYYHNHQDSISSNSSSNDLSHDYNTPLDTPGSINTPMSVSNAIPLSNVNNIHQGVNAITNNNIQQNNMNIQQNNGNGTPLYNYNHSSNSPTLSISSSINGNTPQQQLTPLSNNPIQQLHYQQQKQIQQQKQEQQQLQIQQQQQQIQQQQFQQQQILQQLKIQQYNDSNINQNNKLPNFEQFNHDFTTNDNQKLGLDKFDDYDDEFCLDVDQLNFIDLINNSNNLKSSTNNKNNNNNIINGNLNNGKLINENINDVFGYFKMNDHDNVHIDNGNGVRNGTELGFDNDNFNLGNSIQINQQNNFNRY